VLVGNAADKLLQLVVVM